MVRTGLIALLASGWLLPSAHALEWERWDDSVVRLMTKQGDKLITGTAFAINANGDYVTNHHVIEAALAGNQLLAVEAVAPSLKAHPGEVIWHDAKRDLAVVRVSAWRNPPLTLAPGNALRKDTPVVTLGFPGGSDVAPGPGFTEPKLKRGVVSAVQHLPFYDPATTIPIIEHDGDRELGQQRRATRR